MAELVEQLGRAAYGDAFTGGLNPAQWAALRYFGRANRFSRTVSTFAQFQGTTRGTASQTVKALVKKGHLIREPVTGDRRSFRLRLTAEGRALLADDPCRELTSAASALSPGERSSLAEILGLMLNRILVRRGLPRFGMCPYCSHFRPHACCDHPHGPHECGLLREPLSEQETEQICVNYSDARP